VVEGLRAQGEGQGDRKPVWRGQPGRVVGEAGAGLPLLDDADPAAVELDDPATSAHGAGSSEPPSSGPPGTQHPGENPSGRAPGGQPGHKSHKRVRLEPDEVVTLRQSVASTA